MELHWASRVTFYRPLLGPCCILLKETTINNGWKNKQVCELLWIWSSYGNKLIEFQKDKFCRGKVMYSASFFDFHLIYDKAIHWKWNDVVKVHGICLGRIVDTILFLQNVFCFHLQELICSRLLCYPCYMHNMGFPDWMVTNHFNPIINTWII